MRGRPHFGRVTVENPTTLNRLRSQTLSRPKKNPKGFEKQPTYKAQQKPLTPVSPNYYSHQKKTLTVPRKGANYRPPPKSHAKTPVFDTRGLKISVPTERGHEKRLKPQESTLKQMQQTKTLLSAFLILWWFP